MSKRLQNSRSRDSIALVRKARGLLAVAGACAFDRIFLEASGGSYLLCPSNRVGKGGYGRPTNSPSVIRSGDLAASDARAVISALASPLRFASDSLDDMDPDHTERSLAGLGGSSYTRGLVEKYGDPGHMAVWSYLELASFGGVISLYDIPYAPRRGRQRRRAEHPLPPGLVPLRLVALPTRGNEVVDLRDVASRTLVPHDGAEMVPFRRRVTAVSTAHIRGVHAKDPERKGNFPDTRHDCGNDPVHERVRDTRRPTGYLYRYRHPKRLGKSALCQQYLQSKWGRGIPAASSIITSSHLQSEFPTPTLCP